MKKIKLIIILFLSILISGCISQSIEDIKTEDNIGENVMVSGTVTNSIKIGDFSGYRIEDKNGDTIGIVSDDIPQEGEEITVRGTLSRDTIFGYYIQE
ncbi:MAG: hypothetical protein ACOCRX_00345 [Candidatus Woesearchaeota archaeon]